MKRHVSVKLDRDLEAKFPISIRVPLAGTLALTTEEARQLASALISAIRKVREYYWCKASLGPDAQCGKVGTVKRDGRMYCRKHGKAVRP